MLDRQIHLYSVTTSCFFSNHEKYLYDMMCRYRREAKEVNGRLSDLKKQQTRTQDSKRLCSDLTELEKHKKEKAKQTKKKLLSLLSNRVAQNERTGGSDHLRRIRESALNDNNIISEFDSALSRAIGIKEDTLTEDLIVVQMYYFDVFRDISFYGFLYHGEKYRYFTSSAGQIRQKKAVFIKESVFDRIRDTIMCGLTTEKINAKGGINANKLLAYMALAGSATDEWVDFDIDRSIVIDDFETNVYGTFDFVDESDYSVTRKTGYIPIPHTDGAGMILPSLSDKNFMFRAPWIKGLLGVFDFRRFIEAKGCSPVVADIYGQKHNVVDEDIRIIFTKSQFKMYKYYDSWEEYKTFYKKYHCGAGRCNMEEDRIRNAKINYQMLQTLTDIGDEEIDLLIEQSRRRIDNLCSSKETMMEVLGVTPYNTHMTPFQASVKRYPALLNDTYAKDILRDVKNSLLKKYRSGKLEIQGKYTFLLPDYYAACEYWFEHISEPKGLLADQEVFCRLFPKSEKLDCLRSPHLYKEHAVRINAACVNYPDSANQIGEWFTTDGVYASTHDLISKLLMYDVDGDKSLVVADENLIRIAERNMKDIVPLYYNMKKADPKPLNERTIYDSLITAFTHGNIGIYSNNISKIWNSDVFVNGSDKEKAEAVNTVKLLCMENNFCIDSAKTSYMPKRPEWFSPIVSKYTNRKLPAFFTYAKDKDESQTEERNDSFVNKIFDRIPDRPISACGLKLGKIEYQKLMRDGTVVCPKEVSELYDRLNTRYRYMINMKDERKDNLQYIARKLRKEFDQFGYPEETVADMLTEYLYGREKRYKQLLWFCYGSYIEAHLEQNIPIKNIKYVQCPDCGKWFETASKNAKRIRCDTCQKEYRRQYNKQMLKQMRIRQANNKQFTYK